MAGGGVESKEMRWDDGKEKLYMQAQISLLPSQPADTVAHHEFFFHENADFLRAATPVGCPSLPFLRLCASFSLKTLESIFHDGD